MDHINGVATPGGVPEAWADALPRPGADIAAAEAAVRALIGALGLDLGAEARRHTPGRVARALAEMTTPRPFTPTTFPPHGDDDQAVVVRDIAFQSVCEHHLLPFSGRAHVGYVPGARIIGISKLPRMVDACARGPQVQERLTRDIADWIERVLEPRGVGVVVEATHMCMVARGVRQAGSTTVTRVLRGAMRDPLMSSDLHSGAAQ